MDEMQQAQHELDRLQAIATRHEGFMFTLRGWLLTIVGGLLAAYYTENIVITQTAMTAALLLVLVGFLMVESRHINLVEAVTERAEALEQQMKNPQRPGIGWYDGPKVSEACQDGATRRVPHLHKTFMLNLMFYVVVALIIVVLAFFLPPKAPRSERPAANVSPAGNVSAAP